MKTPVIFIIFNKPSTTKIVFNAIRKAKPEKLYVIADGPRKNKAGEKDKCNQTRKIIEGVDWDCEVTKDYSNVNLGCEKSVVSGINKAFTHFEQAIILEDDCVPCQSFFKFCEEILLKYKDDERIMTVSGNNFLFEKSNIIKDDYYFSRYPHTWGWATWKRAWDLFDDKTKQWLKVKKYIPFKNVTKNMDNNWDVIWSYSSFVNNGLTIVPIVNLVSNIGFSDTGATHPTIIKSKTTNIPALEMKFPLKHTKIIMPNPVADKISEFHFTRIGIIWGAIRSLIKL